MDVDQLRNNVKELCAAMEAHRIKFGYVPAFVYAMLAKYNRRQNEIINLKFRETYCQP